MCVDVCVVCCCRLAVPKGLDSSLKKTGGFKAKLKLLSDQSAKALLAELETINLSKFYEEVALVLATEAKLKSGADIQTAVLIASHCHQRYTDFADHLTDALVKHLHALEAASIAARKPASKAATASAAASAASLSATAAQAAQAAAAAAALAAQEKEKEYVRAVAVCIETVRTD